MRGLMTSIARRPKILGGLTVAVAASALLFILLHLAHSAHPVSAAPPLQSSSTWSTYIDPEQDNGDDEYGYEDNDFGNIGDSSFAVAASESLSPDPSTVNFRANGNWHRFTVNSGGSVRVYVNPGSTPLNVEVYTSSTPVTTAGTVRRGSTSPAAMASPCTLLGVSRGLARFNCRHRRRR